MTKCKVCGSQAINHNCHGRDGSDGDLCDVCYWRKRAVDLDKLADIVAAYTCNRRVRRGGCAGCDLVLPDSKCDARDIPEMIRNYKEAK